MQFDFVESNTPWTQITLCGGCTRTSGPKVGN